MNYEKLKKYSRTSLMTLTWEREGLDILSDDKLYLTSLEREKLKFLLSRQTPSDEIRRKLWLISTGAKKEIKSDKNYYSNLLKYSKTIHSVNEHQINMDLKRTFPEDPYFKEEVTIKKLKNILTCYSIRNCSIGYCQGFNFIAARLLKILKDEEEVFWVFTQILEELMPIGYYSELSGMITDCAILVNLLQKYIPDLYKFFIENAFETSLDNFIHKWFVSLFVQNFAEYFSLIIWDFFFLEGNIILLKACLAAFKILKSDIMEKNNFEDIYMTLNISTNKICDYPNLIFYLSFRQFEFDYNFLNLHRENLSKPVIENINNQNEIKLKLKNKNKITNTNSIKCDTNLPYCIKDNDNDFQHQIISFLAYRIKNYPCKIIDNYYSKHKSFNAPTIPYDFEDILVERRIHTCVELVDIKMINDEEKTQNSNSFLSGHNYTKTSTISQNSQNHDNLQDSPLVNLKLYNNIKKDENFTKANNILNTTFTPKPFKEKEGK